MSIRGIAAVGAAAALLTACLMASAGARADPDHCPPTCDLIPATAWPAGAALPLDEVYRWPSLVARAEPVSGPEFDSDDWCATPPRPDDPRGYAVAAQATVPGAPGQWHLHVQVLHWRGDTVRSGQIVDRVMRAAAVAMRTCLAAPAALLPKVTLDKAYRLAGVVTDPVRGVLHQYLAGHPRSGSLVGLAMWASSPPAVGWPAVDDGEILDALVAPLCEAYIGSCR